MFVKDLMILVGFLYEQSIRNKTKIKSKKKKEGMNE